MANRSTSSTFPNTSSPQTTSHILMVRPVRFGYNVQTAEDNAFQHRSDLKNNEIQHLAEVEFDGFVAQLRKAGLTVSVFEDTPEPHTPDSIFPNNWISTHSKGTIFVYPMYAPNRQQEKRTDIIDYLAALYKGEAKIIDLSTEAASGRFLEGTGSMIMDRTHQRVYACRSHRTDEELFAQFCRETECEGMLFAAVDEAGMEIYHTNVMMALGEDFAVVCLEAIPNPEERRNLQQSLRETGHEIIAITQGQVRQFAGNMLQVRTHDGEPLLVLSQRAYESLHPPQLAALQAKTGLLPIPLDIIETCGGGSVRCMMAEVFVGE